MNCAVCFHLVFYVCILPRSLDLNGFFRMQAMREVELQINTSHKKETCFSHFQISAIAVSAIEGLSYFSALTFLFISSK